MNSFRIDREERGLAVILMIIILLLNTLVISKFFGLFMDYTDGSWNIFMRNFHMSGFDPITYDVVTDWGLKFNAVRHPLLPFFLYPLYLVNHVLWPLTGGNCVQFVVAAMLVFCSFYSFLFFYRIVHQIVGINEFDSNLLLVFFFSFAYVLLTIIIPDHFCLSLFLILYTLYEAGKKIKSNQSFSVWQMTLLFIITAGVTLSNGVIVFLAVLFTNGRKFFNLKYLFTAFFLSVVLLGIGLWLNATVYKSSAKTMASWTDTSSPRIEIIVENVFGESMQLHRKHLLGDVLVGRPVIVMYTWTAQYAVEAVIVLMFVAGIFFGRRSRYLWLCVACFAYAMFLHLVLGFGINEVYIMSAHWIYVVPIAVAYLFLCVKGKPRVALRTIVFSLSAYLWSYNGYLLYHYLTWPLRYK